MSSRDFSEYPPQEGEDVGHRHPGRGPVRGERGGEREGSVTRDGEGWEKVKMEEEAVIVVNCVL